MRTMTETAKKKRGMPSSFTILLALLAIVAVITVIVSGTSGGAVTTLRLYLSSYDFPLSYFLLI